MKKILFSTIALGALFLTSCSSDPCKDKSAVSHCNDAGTLLSNDNAKTCDCSCNTGYFGATCDSVSFTSLVGTYDVAETGASSSSNYQVTASIVGGRLSFLNFADIYKTNGTLADVNKRTISIARQSPNANNTYVETTTNGSIKLNSTARAVITMTYKGTGQNGLSSTFNIVMTQR